MPLLQGGGVLQNVLTWATAGDASDDAEAGSESAQELVLRDTRQGFED